MSGGLWKATIIAPNGEKTIDTGVSKVVVRDGLLDHETALGFHVLTNMPFMAAEDVRK